MKGEGVELSRLKKEGSKYLYQGRRWRLNHPVPSTSKTKKMMVLATKTIQGKRKAKLIHFGARGYGHNYSEKAKKSYLARSANIRNKAGVLTRTDRWSANYWARKILWPKNKPTNGPRKTGKKAA